MVVVEEIYTYSKTWLNIYSWKALSPLCLTWFDTGSKPPCGLTACKTSTHSPVKNHRHTDQWRPTDTQTSEDPLTHWHTDQWRPTDSLTHWPVKTHWHRPVKTHWHTDQWRPTDTQTSEDPLTHWRPKKHYLSITGSNCYLQQLEPVLQLLSYMMYVMKPAYTVAYGSLSLSHTLYETHTVCNM